MNEIDNKFIFHNDLLVLKKGRSSVMGQINIKGVIETGFACRKTRMKLLIFCCQITLLGLWSNWQYWQLLNIAY